MINTLKFNIAPERLPSQKQIVFQFPTIIFLVVMLNFGGVFSIKCSFKWWFTNHLGLKNRNRPLNCATKVIKIGSMAILSFRLTPLNFFSET